MTGGICCEVETKRSIALKEKAKEELPATEKAGRAGGVKLTALARTEREWPRKAPLP